MMAGGYKMTKKCWLAVDSNGDEKMTANTLGFIRFNPMLARKGDYMENRKKGKTDREKGRREGD